MSKNPNKPQENNEIQRSESIIIESNNENTKDLSTEQPNPSGKQKSSPNSNHAKKGSHPKQTKSSKQTDTRKKGEYLPPENLTEMIDAQIRPVISELQHKIALLEERCTVIPLLSETIGTFQQTIEAKDKEIEIAKAEIARLNIEIVSSNDNAAQLRKELAQIRQEKAEVSKEKTEAEKRIALQEEALASLEQEKSDLEARLAKIKEIGDSVTNQAVNTLLEDISSSLKGDYEIFSGISEACNSSDYETMRFTLMRLFKKLKSKGVNFE